jgi:hypothetical protein
MEEVPGGGTGARRNEDIALDLMKFVAMTTGYGRTTSSGVGFQGTGAAAKPEEYAGHLLELYTKCLQSVAGKKYSSARIRQASWRAFLQRKASAMETRHHFALRKSHRGSKMCLLKLD